ncbi:MAG: metal-dependent hydrolase, partial [Candidatus Hydrogenedentes bacterium]|nr:metal-dependent hydrolase [Candidatus Hydrogenedentota bacterium]
MDRHDLLAHLVESRDAVLAEFDGAASGLDRAYAPGKWTVRQLLVHIADVELVHLWRLSRAWAEPGSPVYAFDHDRWVTELRYDERPLDICRGLFTGVRDQIVWYVRTQPDAAFANTVIHSENGP